MVRTRSRKITRKTFGGLTRAELSKVATRAQVLIKRGKSRSTAFKQARRELKSGKL
jgi:hypothetical protein